MDERFTVTAEDVSRFEAAFDADRANAVAMTAVINNGLLKSAKAAGAVQSDTHVFSVSLKQGEITSQKQSGRCWMFAGLNVIRSRIMREREMKNFELSQAYLFFYDKLEKSGGRPSGVLPAPGACGRRRAVGYAAGPDPEIRPGAQDRLSGDGSFLLQQGDEQLSDGEAAGGCLHPAQEARRRSR